MRWLRHLLPSSQLRDCRFVLQAMAGRYQAEIAWRDIERRTMAALVAEEPMIRRRMLVQGDRAKDVVGDIVAALCLNDIEHGGDHVYRGRLGMQGQSKRNIFAGVLTEQIKDGWITVKEANVANENMNRAVAGAG